MIKQVLLFFRCDVSFHRLKNDVALYRQIYSKDSIENRRFYNLGAGAFRHPCWTNVDHKSDWYRSVQGHDFIEWDLLSLTRIRVADNSAEIVYCSHTIEHITDDAAQNMFNEAFRILKKGGVFRVTTPNIDLEYRAFKEKDRQFFYWKKDKSFSLHQIFLSHFASSASISDHELDKIFSKMEYEEALNYCISRCSLETQRNSPGGHINWWNAKKLRRMIGTAGFREVCLSGYGQSSSPVLRNTRFFDNTHIPISIYMEAIK